MTDIITDTSPNAIIEAEIESLREQLKVYDLMEQRDYLANRLAEHIRKQQEQKRMAAHFKRNDVRNEK